MQRRHKRKKVEYGRWLVLLLASLLIGLLIWQGPPLVRLLLNNPQEKVDLVTLMNAGDYLRVLALSEMRLRDNPLDSEALAFAGFASYYLGIYSAIPDEKTNYLNQAVYYLRTSLNVNDDSTYSTEVLYVLGKTYHLLGDSYANLVVSSLLQALSRGYRGLEINEYLGMAYIRLGEYNKGIDYFLAAMAGERTSNFYYTLAQAYGLVSEWLKAEEYYLMVLEQGTDDNLKDKARFELAELYYESGRLAEARELFLTMLQKYPNNGYAHFILGKVYYAENNFSQATVQWHRALRLNPQNSEAFALVYGS
jgi:tetratricopeptide (TPR) repeat protein